jgi:hypothetical protein
MLPQLHFTPFTRKLNVVYRSGRSSGLVFMNTFPLISMAFQQWHYSNLRVLLADLTATGIAPDLHRISLFIPALQPGTESGVKVRDFEVKNREA